MHEGIFGRILGLQALDSADEFVCRNTELLLLLSDRVS